MSTIPIKLLTTDMVSVVPLEPKYCSKCKRVAAYIVRIDLSTLDAGTCDSAPMCVHCATEHCAALRQQFRTLKGES